MIVSEALGRAVQSLLPSRTASLDAQVLLAFLLERPRSWILAHEDAALNQSQWIQYMSLIRQRSDGVPVAYLQGHVEWFDLTLEVRPGTLIPRPETELLLEEAIRIARDHSIRQAADIGTGSGALAIGLARAMPQIALDAVEVSRDALVVAGVNVKRYELTDRVRLLRGSLLEPLTQTPELVMANLPYLSDAMMGTLDRDVRHEPAFALHGGESGLELYESLLQQLRKRDWLPRLLVEIDPSQTQTLKSLISAMLPQAAMRVLQDYAGHDRIAVVAPRE